MYRATLTLSAVLLATVASAQTEGSTTKPAAAAVSTTEPQATDSPLVQAAKRSMKARQKSTVIKINDANVKNSTKLLTTTDNQRVLPKPAPQVTQASAAVVTTIGTTEQKPTVQKAETPRPMDDAEGLYDEEAPPPPQPPAQKPKP